MTAAQKRILLVLAIAIALTRPLAVAYTLNDWDEALFSLGVAEYDVNKHHPHPPGYPLFVAAAKGVHLVGLNEFRSVQIVVLLGAFFLFPALFFLAREIGFSFTTAVCGAAVFAFLPNVWVYGGTAFSDIPAVTLGFAACALLLRGRRDSLAYVAGAIVLGIAAGVRVPNLLLGAAPALLATYARLRARDFKSVVLAMVAGAAIAGGSYLGAAKASGTLAQYRFVLRSQSEYVRTVDSWQNPNRAPLHEVAKLFLLHPLRVQELMDIVTGLALIGILAALVRRRWEHLLPLLIFGPAMLVAWLNLDVEAAGRYAIAYLAAYTLLAAHGLRVIGRVRWVQAALTTVLVVVFAVWAWPALRVQRTTPPPHVAAMLWIRDHVAKTAPVYVHGVYGPHGAYLLPGHNVGFYEDVREITRFGPDTWVLEPRPIEGAMNFAWPRTNPLWNIIRRRNFEASLQRLQSFVQYGDGFYEVEGEQPDTFRWMGREAHAKLPPMRNDGRLYVNMYLPLDAIQPPPAVEVWVNGALVERIEGAKTPQVERTWTIPSRPDRPNELRIVTSDVVVPAKIHGSGDTRELGLRIDELTWTPAL